MMRGIRSDGAAYQEFLQLKRSLSRSSLLFKKSLEFLSKICDNFNIFSGLKTASKPETESGPKSRMKLWRRTSLIGVAADRAEYTKDNLELSSLNVIRGWKDLINVINSVKNKFK